MLVNNIRQRNRISKFLILITVIFATVSISAADAVTINDKAYGINLEDAQKTAVANTLSLKEVDQKINHLLSGKDYNPSIYKGVKDNVLADIEDLYSKASNSHNISSLELGILYGYYAMYGETVYFKNKDMSHLFNPEDYPNYSLWSSLLRYEFNKKSSINNISLNIRKIYDNILILNDQIGISDTSLQIAQKSLAQEKKKCEQGEISEVSFEKSKMNIEIQIKELAKLRRNVENLKFDLKKQLGIPLKDEIVLKDYDYSNLSELKDYYEYLEKAITDRNEISLARLNYWDGKNVYYKANNSYMDNMQSVTLQLQRENALNQIREAEESIKEANTKVKQEILSLYITANSKYSAVKAAENSVALKDKKYKAAQTKYIQKAVTKIDLDKSLLDLNTEKVKYRKAIIEYNTAKETLEVSCSVGVGLT